MAHDNNDGATAALAILGIAFAGAAMKNNSYYGGFYNNSFYDVGYSSPLIFTGGHRHHYHRPRIRRHSIYPRGKTFLPGLDTGNSTDILSSVIHDNYHADPSGLLNIPYTQSRNSFTVEGPFGNVGLENLSFPNPYTYYSIGF